MYQRRQGSSLLMICFVCVGGYILNVIIYLFLQICFKKVSVELWVHDLNQDIRNTTRSEKNIDS